MQEQREDLIKRLEEDGWKIIEEDEYSLDWWAAEIWRVESVWSPQGFFVYLTFLVDPQGPFEPKHEHIWGIGTTQTIPTSWHEAQGKPFLTIGQGWGTRATQFVNDLARIRHEAFVKEMKQ